MNTNGCWIYSLVLARQGPGVPIDHAGDLLADQGRQEAHLDSLLHNGRGEYDIDLLISNPFANIQDLFISQFHLSSISIFLM